MITRGVGVEDIRIDSDNIVDVVFHLKWKSDNGIHTDGYQASRINIWRDFLPPLLLDNLKGRQVGERIEIRLNADDALPKFDEKNVFQIKRSQFNSQVNANTSAQPAVGRFYPKGLLKDIPGVFRVNVQPFRCVQLTNGHMQVDFNHPLSGKDLVLSALIGKVENKMIERGGSSVDWMEVLTTGPGMQERWRNQQTDFFSAEAFTRDDEAPDAQFYRNPR
jgi:FKBP-type peptidyl-prolyl cis-trans isomerase 2